MTPDLYQVVKGAEEVSGNHRIAGDICCVYVLSTPLSFQPSISRTCPRISMRIVVPCLRVDDFFEEISPTSIQYDERVPVCVRIVVPVSVYPALNWTVYPFVNSSTPPVSVRQMGTYLIEREADSGKHILTHRPIG